MNSNVTSRVGVLDALTAGLVQAARRPWLLILPAAIDFALWIAPRLSIGNLLTRFVDLWESLLPLIYAPGQMTIMADMISMVREVMTEAGAQLNLAEVVTGNWLGVPSVIAANHASRLTFISDIVLAPMGVSLHLSRVASPPWQSERIPISSVWVACLAVIGLWLIGQMLVALYLRWIAADRLADGAIRWMGLPGFLRLALWLTLWGLLLGIGLLALQFPLYVTATVMVLTGGTGAGILFALVGGVTLWLTVWFLLALFFVSEAILLDGQSLWRGVVQSVSMVRMGSFSTLGLILVINLVLLGFRAVWAGIGRTPAGALFAIVGNAYLVTSMLLGIFVYYEDLRNRWLARLAEVSQHGQPNERH